MKIKIGYKDFYVFEKYLPTKMGKYFFGFGLGFDLTFSGHENIIRFYL
jgi:hypothetical protein